MKRLLLYVPIILLILFVSCFNNGMQNPTITDEDEYEIFNAIIDSLYANTEFIHVIQLTSRIDSSNTVSSFLDFNEIAYDPAMMTDFVDRNDTINFLDCSRFNDPVRGIAFDKMMAYFLSSDSNEGWNGYYRDYPNSSGYISFKRPGFDPMGRMAVLEFGSFSHYLAAQGYIAVLEKLEGVWTITHLLYTWVS